MIPPPGAGGCHSPTSSFKSPPKHCEDATDQKLVPRPSRRGLTSQKAHLLTLTAPRPPRTPHFCPNEPKVQQEAVNRGLTELHLGETSSFLENFPLEG